MSADFEKYRSEIAGRLVEAEASLAAARTALSEATPLLAVVKAERDAAWAAAGAAAGKRFDPERGVVGLPLAGALRRMIEDAFAQRVRDAESAEARPREAIKDIEWRIADLREALVQVDRIITPPTPDLAATMAEQAPAPTALWPEEK